MKKIRNILIMGILGFIFMPIVNAASIDFGTSESADNTVKIPVKLKVDENDQFNQIKLGCETDNDSVKCKVEAVSGNGVQAQASGDDTLFVNPTGNFSSGEISLCNIILTNESDAKQSNVSMTVKNIELLAEDNTSVAKLDNKSKNGFQVKVKETAPEQKTSSDATLSKVVWSQGTMTPEFSSSVTKYTIYDISDTVNSIKLSSYTCNDGTNCYISLDGGDSVSSKTVYLARGENTIKLNVTSSDGTKKNTYTFTVYRGETAFNSSKLASLSFGDYVLTPAFDKNTYEYTMTIPHQVNSIDSILKYTFEDTNLTDKNLKKDGTDNLIDGENIVKLTISNASGNDETVYTIKVTRETDSAITLISYINAKITFKDAEGNEKSLTEEEFKKVYPDEWSKIINKEYKFDEEGNLIVEKEEEKEEPKEEKKSGSKLWLIIILVVVGIAIIAVAGIFIFRKKPEDKNKKGKNKDDINEEGIEEKLVKEENKEEIPVEDKTVEIDEALSDLLNTKQYNFDDEE